MKRALRPQDQTQIALHNVCPREDDMHLYDNLQQNFLSATSLMTVVGFRQRLSPRSNAQAEIVH